MNAAPAVTLGVIRSLRFDSVFIFGCAILALLAGVLVVEHPVLFVPLLLADVWLLGAQHVVATYTRLCFDKVSLQQNRFLVFALPVLVFLGVVGAIFVSNGTTIISTVYLYWQWFHYTRQSYGVHRIYSRKSPTHSPWDDKLTAWALYSMPLWGILYRSHQKIEEPETRFLYNDFWAIPAPLFIVNLVGAISLALALTWALRQVHLFRQDKLSVAHTAYVVSHFAIFLTGYCLIKDITFGWLVINTWHNSQYILIVWMFNNNRFSRGADPNARFLSMISQRDWILQYFTVFAVLAIAFYGAVNYFNLAMLNGILPALGIVGLGPAAATLTYQAINFHHYLVDGIIWKVRKKANQQGLGLAPVPERSKGNDAVELNRIDAELEAVV